MYGSEVRRPALPSIDEQHLLYAHFRQWSKLRTKGKHYLICVMPTQRCWCETVGDKEC